MQAVEKMLWEGERIKAHRVKFGGNILTEKNNYQWERKCNGLGGKGRFLTSQPCFT